jgi:site-specific DNA-methyltransferase (adenine-specific)
VSEVSDATNQAQLEPLLNKIFNEDCLEGMKRIPDKSIDMILCDLPYGTTQNKWDAVIPFELLWEQYERIIKPNGAIVLTAAQPFTSALIMSNPKLFRYEWIWEKNTATGFMNANKMPLRAHENILVFYSGLPTYNPQFVFGEPYSKKRNKRVDTGENYGEVGIKVHSDIKNEGKRYPRSVVQVKREERAIHPTQKPVALFEYLIRTYTNAGEVVLDSCIGSGTTAVACVLAGRSYIGFESDEKYFQLAQKRASDAHVPVGGGDVS